MHATHACMRLRLACHNNYVKFAEMSTNVQSIPMPTTENHVRLSWPSESVYDSPTFSITALKQH